MSALPQSTDVVIAGAGMAGLVAGVALTEQSEDVLVVEKGSRPGGSMRLSGGTIWTWDDVATATAVAPQGNKMLQSLVVDRYEESIEWLTSQGVDLTEQPTEEERTIMDADPEQMTNALVETLERNGGTVQTDTPMKRLREREGDVAGLVVADDGSEVHIESEAVILATGGFQGDDAMVEQHITDRPDRLWLRGNPWSTGDGYRAAAAVDAKLTRGTGWFYGHNMAAPPATVRPEEFIDLTQYYGPRAVAVNQRGQRFVDESACDGEDELAVATAREADGRAYYVLDATLYESEISSGSQVKALVDRVERAGGAVASAESIQGLTAALSDWDLDGARLVETLTEYNAAMTEGNRLDPPRTTDRRPLDTPPMYVVAVQPGITQTTGGVAVTARMEGIDRTRSRSTLTQDSTNTDSTNLAPIAGLYAAGASVGNVHNGGYIGGLATALVTGRIAASAAHDDVQ
ncbi:FAD-dependent oxidoreductase [Halovenus marina]|uniref:FAD-dependent oxidoreductase n=1 Tax=Halovenus marina TaxID=3396621 RepID=UPI003F5785E4